MRMRRTQQGVAMIILAVVVMGVAFIVVKTLNAASWKADRLRVTNQTILQAKEALIARAVADDNRPGSLPCPDTDNDGVAELFAGNQCPSYIGRLPWRTLDVPDIRDAHGERLWYVLSRTHRDDSAAEPINSDTIGEIAVSGVAPAAGVLAALISPGPALIRAGAPGIQLRDCPANCNNPVNYLDSAGGLDNAVWAVVGGVVNLTQVPESDTFNDRLVAIHSDDIMPLVERRAAREIALAARTRYQNWKAVTGRGFYPWPAPFNDPANPGLGVNGTLHGHLPATATALVWTSASTTIGTCSGVNTPTLTCTATVGLGVLTITGRVGNIATRFAEAPVAPSITGIPLWDTYNWTLDGTAQALDFTYNAILGVVTVTVQAPVLSSWAPAASPWLVNNQWNRVATYAISSDHSISGLGTCSGNCISIRAGALGTDDKEAVVLMTGRKLTTQVRPPATLPADVGNYLEAENATPADRALQRDLRTTAFNDQPIPVAP